MQDSVKLLMIIVPGKLLAVLEEIVTVLRVRLVITIPE
jgi:hypothetical protein